MSEGTGAETVGGTERRLDMKRAWLVMTFTLALALPAAGSPAQRAVRARVVYQGRNAGQEQSDRFSGKYRIGRDGRVSITNIAGDITVTAGSGEEASVEAIKRTRGDRSELGFVRIEVDNGPGRVDIRTVHSGRNDHVSVDYTVTVPAGASLEVHSISGSVKITGVRGVVRAESVSGGMTAASTPRLELAKTISGNVSVTDVADGDTLALGTISGGVSARSVKARSLQVSSISGQTRLTDVTSDRLTVKAISGGVEYEGPIVTGGSYDFNVHSGTIRLALSNPAGFVLNANSFSGAIRSELPLTIGGDTNVTAGNRRGRRDAFMTNHSIRATYGDGSATVTVRTFSGDIIISRR
jgi:DUF4097 and DUF4098 domain-containing protein YvlB